MKSQTGAGDHRLTGRNPCYDLRVQTKRIGKMGKRRELRMAFALLLGVVGSGPALGQQPTQQQPQRPLQAPLQNPRALPEHRRLAFLLGQWEEEVTYAGPEQRSGRGRWRARPAMGLYLVFDYEGEGPEGRYGALGVLAYDRGAGDYRLWWFDSSAAIGEYRGNWADENTLVLEHRGTVEGRPFRERISYRRVSLAEVRTRIEQAWDNEEYKPYLEAVARRAALRQRSPAGQPQRPQ